MLWMTRGWSFCLDSRDWNFAICEPEGGSFPKTNFKNMLFVTRVRTLRNVDTRTGIEIQWRRLGMRPTESCLKTSRGLC